VTSGTQDQDGAGLVALIDQLERLLNESELSELEIEAGQTAFVLRKPAALGEGGESRDSGANAAATATAASESVKPSDAAADEGHTTPGGHAILAPLTGLYYNSPSPGAEPYVREGGPVVIGQVIGLIEAMKLFNEIKSDVAGRVVRIFHESGALVKAKQPLIEVEPT
jgi:acetyl-CoA carboxylase biotin carboxyl carrier protein